jgi:hypothetical protein
MPPPPFVPATAAANVPAHSAVSTPAGGNGSPTGPSTSATAGSGHRPGDVSQSAGPAGNTAGNHSSAEQAAKNAAKSGADDSVLLAVLVLGFAVAVSGVVIVAGRRGGHRVR